MLKEAFEVPYFCFNLLPEVLVFLKSDFLASNYPLTCAILKSNIRLGSSLTFQWLLKVSCLPLYDPYNDWSMASLHHQIAMVFSMHVSDDNASKVLG